MQKVTFKPNPDFKVKPVPPGTRLKHAIHAVVEALPFSAKTKQAIKDCGGCLKREGDINAAYARWQARLAERRARRANGRPPDAG